MTIWSFSEQSDENRSGCPTSHSPYTPPNLLPFEIGNLISPRLDVGDIDAVPFSNNFADLFEGLGLHMAQSAEQKRCGMLADCNESYDIENYTNIKAVNPDWKHDEIEEIMVISPKRPVGLPTIPEDMTDSSMSMTRTALLSDFEIEDFEPSSGTALANGTNICVRRDTGQKCLIKRRRIRKNLAWSERTILDMLAGFSLPFVEHLHWSFQNGEHSYIVTDYHTGGSLMDLVNRHGSLPSHQAVFYASELVAAISSLHAAGVFHCNIQPENIAIDAVGHIVLTNFAHARFAAGSTNLTDHENLKMNQNRAPEVYMGWNLNGAVDCWAFGMVLYFMFFGAHPYGGREGVEDEKWFRDCVVGFRIPTESLRLVHPMARDLVLHCLERNPAIRWTMEKVKMHRYFAQIDWDQVSAKRLDVPSFGRSAMEVDRATFQFEIQKRPLSLNPSLFDNDHLASKSSSTLRRTHSVRDTTRSHRVQHAPVLPELFMPGSSVSIPAAIEEEDEPISESMSASTGHPCVEERQRPHPQELDPVERMSRFWADIDREERGSATSTTSLEFGESNGVPYTEAPKLKLRKHRSAIQSSHRLFTLSTTSLQNKLRKKPRSTSALRPAKPVEPIQGLPMGVHQIGSGIGFSYNVPAGVPSKVSVCSFAPPTCHHLFHGGFSKLSLGLPARRTVEAKAKAQARAQAAKLKAKTDQEAFMADNPIPISGLIASGADDMDDLLEKPARARLNSRSREEVGNGTFIRDMYRTPSWIVSPPECLPSPKALVNSESSPSLSDSSIADAPAAASASASEPELLTPATLVGCVHDVNQADENQDDEVNISIPKSLKLDLDFELCQWASAPDSTLRLVPPVPAEMRLSYVGEESLIEELTMGSFSIVVEA